MKPLFHLRAFTQSCRCAGCCSLLRRPVPPYYLCGRINRTQGVKPLCPVVALIMPSLPILLVAFLALPLHLTAQQDTATVEIVYSRFYRNLDAAGTNYQYLSGDIEIRHRDMVLYCDSATIINRREVYALGDVNIQQADTINVLTDTLYYSSVTRKAVLTGQVSLSDSKATLTTRRLDYDARRRIALYTTGGTIRSKEAQLRSQSGRYELTSSTAHFERKVRLDHPDVILTADTLDFNTNTEIAYFQGPTYIQDSTRQLYCEDGYYDLRRQEALFEQNTRYSSGSQLASGHRIKYLGNERQTYRLEGEALLQDDEQRIAADTIVYYKTTNEYEFLGNTDFRNVKGQTIAARDSRYEASSGMMRLRGDVTVRDGSQIIIADELDYHRQRRFGTARGNVVWRDTINRLRIECSAADYNDSTGYLLARGVPLLENVVAEGDTLWLLADTLRSIRPDPTDTTQRLLLAYHQVLMYKNDMQGICDSLVYTSADSSFTLHCKPVLWANNSEFRADTVRLALHRQQIEYVLLQHGAFIAQPATSTDTLFFQQIKGRNMRANFVNNRIRRLDVEAEAEVVFYLTEEGTEAYIGVNEVQAKRLVMHMDTTGQLEELRFYQQPTSNLYPMGQVNHRNLRRSGFAWQPWLRPAGVAVLYRERQRRLNLPLNTSL